MAKKATKYRMDTVKIRAELRKDPSKWTVDADGFGELVGWKLPYYAGGEPLTEGECADLLGLSDRQVRNLAKKGLPRQRVRRQWRYPSLDAMHWRCAYELERARQRGRSLNHLSLTRPARPQTPVKTAVGTGGEGTFSGRSPSARNCRTADTGIAPLRPRPPAGP